MPAALMTNAIEKTRRPAPAPMARRPFSRPSTARPADVAELQRLLEGVAKLVVEDATYLPIFERLEGELLDAQAADPVSRARALAARQKAML